MITQYLWNVELNLGDSLLQKYLKIYQIVKTLKATL